MLRRFEVRRAASVAEAVALRQQHGADGALYAGGTELLMAMRMGLARWPLLIDVKHIAALRGVARSDGVLRIGAAVTHWELERDPLVASLIPAFAELERSVANVRVRAAGTLGGNIAFAEPHADPPALLAALGARVVLEGAAGQRTLPLGEFLTGMYQTALGEDEILVAVEVPVPAHGTRVAYVKFQILERPSVGVAVVAASDGLTVVVGAVDEVPRRADTASLGGADLRSKAAADAVADAAMRAVDPVADLAGSAEYKKHLVGVFARRALAKALA
jgi:aerobic carbon-monoxide dehydrogenase medium subunit